MTSIVCSKTCARYGGELLRSDRDGHRPVPEPVDAMKLRQVSLGQVQLTAAPADGAADPGARSSSGWASHRCQPLDQPGTHRARACVAYFPSSLLVLAWWCRSRSRGWLRLGDRVLRRFPVGSGKSGTNAYADTCRPGVSLVVAPDSRRPCPNPRTVSVFHLYDPR